MKKERRATSARAEKQTSATTSTGVIPPAVERPSSVLSVVSEITGRTVLLNPSADRLAVSPHFTKNRLRAASEDWSTVLAEAEERCRAARSDGSNVRMSTIGYRVGLLTRAKQCFAATSAEELAVGVEQVIHSLNTVVRRPKATGGLGSAVGGVPTRVMELLVILWQHGLLIFPAGMIWKPAPYGYRSFPAPEGVFYGKYQKEVARLLDGARPLDRAALGRLLLVFGEVEKLGDIGSSAIQSLRPHVVLTGEGETGHPMAHTYGVVDRLRALQLADYGSDPVRASKVQPSYRGFLWQRGPNRADPSFAWLSTHGPRLVAWQASAAGYVAGLRRTARVRQIVNALNHLLDYVIETPDLPAEPVEYCRRGFTPSTPFHESLAQRLGSDRSSHYVATLRRVERFLAIVINEQRNREASASQSQISSRSEQTHRGGGGEKRGGVSKTHDDDPDESVSKGLRVAAEVRNPIPRATARRTPGGQTYRNLIPLRFLRMLREIIEEPDQATGEPTYAWARSLSGDQFLWQNPETGATETVWSPVRAYYVLLRLLLPLRGFQVRMLDSGEGDPLVYRPVHRYVNRDDKGLGGADGHGGANSSVKWSNHEAVDGNRDSDWVPNTGPCAPTHVGLARTGSRADSEGLAGGRSHRTSASGNTQRRSESVQPQGFVRRLRIEEDGSTLNGFYINTNKTADRNGDWETMGYEIAWQQDEVLRIFTALRDFQERYNPIHRPLGRNELHDRSIRASADVARKMRPVHFLFRDPYAKRHPHEPLTESRAADFWNLLIGRLEEVLDSKNLRRKDGERYTLVERRDPSGRPTAVCWDQHSLRVAGLTHLANAGVPLQVLSSFVAGHASVLMTYYYTKQRPSDIHDTLSKGLDRLRATEAEVREFAAYERDAPLSVLLETATYNDPSAVGHFKEANPGAIEWMEHGICPAGGALCHEGGPLLATKSSEQPVYGPVPGGARNCPMCRFFVTGPAWLPALMAQYNATVFAVHEGSKRLRSTQERRRALAAKHGSGAFDAGAWEDPALSAADQAVTTATESLLVRIQTLSRQPGVL